MQRRGPGLAKRAASGGLAALVAAAALAIALPIAHGHLDGAGPTAPGLSEAPPADGAGPDAGPPPECPLCLAASHGSTGLASATALATPPEAPPRGALPAAPDTRPAARRGPASPRAPPLPA